MQEIIYWAWVAKLRLGVFFCKACGPRGLRGSVSQYCRRHYYLVAMYKDEPAMEDRA